MFKALTVTLFATPPQRRQLTVDPASCGHVRGRLLDVGESPKRSLGDGWSGEWSRVEVFLLNIFVCFFCGVWWFSCVFWCFLLF